MEKGMNRHHPDWNASIWRQQRITRLIREYPGKLIPMVIVDHNQLHREIPPMKPPIASLSKLMLHNLTELDNPDPLVNLASQASFLLSVSEQDSRFGEDAFRIGSHYLDQVLFINEARKKRGIA